MLGLKLLIFENNPKNVHALRDITSYAQKLKKFDIALSYFDILLSISPDDYVAWNNIGLIYEELGDWQKAFSAYKKALSLKDFFSPNFNLGIMSRKMHKFDDSIKYLKKAVVQNPKSPQPKYSLSMSYMMLKDFKNGYPLYSNHMSVIMPYYYKNEWDGTMQMKKTLCIFTTGGLGDMIMYARYFQYLKGQFKKIYILLPETLHKIFKRTYPELEILNSSSVFTDYDYAIAPMHILKLFNLDFNRIVPDTGGFLKADEDLIKKFKNEFFNHDKLKIAINWHGNREGTRTFFNRSMPLDAFEPLFEKYKENAVFYSIQKDDSHIEAEKYPNIVDMYNYINDFDDTAAILKNVDFLVSIDSSPVHMAGALGVKTFVLLPFANEWRWFNEGEKTLWYDSVTLLRQNAEGNWQSVIE
ncbi:MAG: tetratricopeptide repeat protein, partial [Candidatus Gastranaerophilales bacterium]|nr:tetratricopeptide repeat protein [Candidatus Gastranaerophilales bacterium]